MTDKTPWEILSRIDVSEKIEKKNGMSYLSWAWAWGVLKEHFPRAWFRKHEGPHGYPYFMDSQGYCFVKVTVGLDHTGDHEITETFPILDHRNRAIQGPNSFDVNNALQRCLTKAIAYHGLGHYIYAGEDVPQEAQEAPAERQADLGGQGQRGSQTGAQRPSPQAGDGITVTGPDGSSSSHPVATVGAVFLAFIPACNSEDDLNKFWTSNSQAVSYLKANGGDLYQQIVDAFKARKAELKTTQA